MQSHLGNIGGAGLLLLAGACTDDGNVVEKNPNSSSSADATTSFNTGGTSQTGGGGTSTQQSGSGGTSGTLCGGDPRMQCAVDCDGFECGEPTSGFDEDGCLRDPCIYDNDCPSSERCVFSPAGGEGGGAGESAEVCVTVWSICEPNENGRCSCGGGAACQGYCVLR